MKKAKVLITAVSLLLIPVIGVCETNGWTGNLSVFLGKKYLDKDDWKPFEDQAEIGFLLDFRPKNWPVNIAIDYLDSGEYELQDISGTITRVDVETKEIDIGIRKIFEVSPTIRPYVGAGVAYIRGKYKGITSDDDDGTGIWVDVGLYWAFIEHFNIGVDFRYSKAEITLFGSDVEAGGFHVGFIGGFRW
jgi:opacity protein-like surface antigen